MQSSPDTKKANQLGSLDQIQRKLVNSKLRNFLLCKAGGKIVLRRTKAGARYTAKMNTTRSAHYNKFKLKETMLF